MRLMFRLFAVLLVFVLGAVPMLASSTEAPPVYAATTDRPVSANTVRTDNHDDDDEDDDDDDDDSNDNDDDDDSNDNDDDDDDGNDNDDDEDDDGGDDNDNEDEDDWSPPPPPPPVAAPELPPAPDVAARCLQTGDELVIEGPNGALRVKAFQNNLNVEMRRLDAGSLPRPGAGAVLFAARMSASPCGGQPYTELPSEVNLGLTYTDQAVSGRDESKFALMFYDGQSWAVAPKHFTDQANNHVSSSTTRPGVYALVQQ